MGKKALHIIAAACLAAASNALAQTPAPAFEVASIKPAPPIGPGQMMSGGVHIGMTIDGARVDIGSLSLRDLVTAAYAVKPYQVSGPDWLGAERFDIVAKLPDGATRDQVPQMLQALLAERFKLVVHRENKEQPVYGLVVGKNGPKLKESDPATPAGDGTAPPPPPGGSSQISIARDTNGVTVSGGRLSGGPTHITMGPNRAMHLESSKMTMASFADLLGRFVDRPVVDMTGLKGSYDVALDLSMEELRSAARGAGMMMPGGGPMRGGEPGMSTAPVASDPSGSSIFAAVQQLGLKLEPRKDVITTIVVDHAEKMPTEN